MRILVVDDSDLVRTLAQEALEDASHNVVGVRSVEEVAELRNSGEINSFDIILMDVSMPQLFGDDVALVLRQNADFRAKILLFSSLDETELAERAAEAKCDGYVCKQLGLAHLVARIAQLSTI
ncbi:MAG: response regulator transcription factor [Kofleriaceae bacterium]|nr:response regulator transcription factor [Kofleriaceae bacterium]